MALSFDLKKPLMKKENLLGVFAILLKPNFFSCDRLFLLNNSPVRQKIVVGGLKVEGG